MNIKKSFFLILPFLILSLTGIAAFCGSMLIKHWNLSFMAAFSIVNISSFCVFSIISIIFINQKVLNPLKKMNINLIQASDDLSVRLNNNSNDEIGTLSGNINLFINKIYSMINDLKGIVDTSTEIGENVETGTRRSANLGKEVSLQLSRNSNILKELSLVVQDASGGVGSVSHLMKTVVELIVETQSASVEETTASIEEMMASLNSISRITEEKRVLSDQLFSLSTLGAEDMDRTVSSIQQVSSSAEVIHNMVQVITDVAAKTNLLAMNAAIEAAHAGNAGRGFSVVAGEIKKLAETTNRQVTTISHSMREISGKMNDAFDVSTKTGVSIHKIIAGIKDLTGGMTEISSSITELSIGSKQITEAMNSLQDSTVKVKEGSRETETEIAKVYSSMKSVVSKSEETVESSDAMNILMGEIQVETENLLKQGKLNVQQISGIDKRVQIFTSSGKGRDFVIGYNDVPPYCMKGKGDIAVGATIDFFREVLKDMGVHQIRYRPVQSLSRMYELINRNEIDAYTLSTRIYEPHPEYNIVSPTSPSIVSVPGFLMLKENPLQSISSFEDLVTLRISTKNGMPLTQTLSNAESNIQFFGGANPLSDSIGMMLKGRTDAVYSLLVGELLYMAKQLGIQDIVKPVYLPDPELELFTVFSEKAADMYMERYESSFKKLSKEFSLDSMLKKYYY